MFLLFAQTCKPFREGFRALAAIAFVAAAMASPSAAQQRDALEPKIITDAKAAVIKVLNDPESARFQSLSQTTGANSAGQRTPIVCGLVNFKNKMGGYEGFRPFIYDVASGGLSFHFRERASESLIYFVERCPELMQTR